MSSELELTLEGSLLKAKGFASKTLDYEAVAGSEKSFLEKLDDADSVELDLASLSKDDYKGIVLFMLCAELCRKHKKSMKICGIDNDSLAELLKKIGYSRDGEYHSPERREQKPRSVFVSAGEAAIKFQKDLTKIIRFTGEVFLDFLFLIRHPRKIDRREVLFYMDKSGADAIPIVSMICFLVGLILAFQGLAQLNKFGLQVYIADLVGLSIIRELGPLMVAMICIGRAGSAFAAELGTMKVSEELDAINTMGLSPARFLVLPKIAALVIAMPMLVVIGDFAGICGGIFVTSVTTDITISSFCERLIASTEPMNAVESLLKGFVFAFIIAGVGCFRGMEADNDAKGVGMATTSSVVSGVFLVVIADAAITTALPHVMALFGVQY